MQKLMRLVRSHSNNPLRVIETVLRDLIERLPLKRCYLASGSAAPLQGATQTGSSRIVTCLSGRDEMIIPQASGGVRELALQPYEAVYIAPAAWNLVLHRRAFSFLTIDFKPQHIRYYFRVQFGRGMEPHVATVHFRPGPASPGIAQLLRTLELREWFTAETATAIVSALIRESLGELRRNPAAPPSRSEAAWLLLRQHIEEQLAEPLTRTDVAVVAGVHPNHVSRLFRAHENTSYTKFLRACRLERAVELLKRYDLTVKEIAARCGFSDAAYFCKIFVRRMGISPGRYRAKQARHAAVRAKSGAP